MNYFGLFFSFMIPGVILGGMAVIAVHQELERRRRQKARLAQRASRAPHASHAPRAELKPVADKQKLYVHDMSAAA